ncbi:hypothetical protein Tco_1053626 [Tanacetum coccineum]|uniref:Reverse transcriptase domain-containing protein n=1 Tax=Tanacetum coccineum TaxID=301880 RepID=A0ABQ5GUW4_9ASTR
MKPILTHSGVLMRVLPIPTNPSPKKVVERETEETTDKEQTNFQGSTAHVRPPVNPIPILEPDVPKTLPKPIIHIKMHANLANLFLRGFADELALLDPFPPGNEDFDFEADLREFELLLNHDPSTDFSPTITNDLNPERFSDKPALACLPPPGDDESFLNKDVQEILEDVERKDSNVSNFDEPVSLNTPLFDEDECFDPGGKINKIDAFMDDYNDLEGEVLKILHNTTHNFFPEVFFDHEPQGLKDEPNNDDLMTEDKVFNPGVMEKIFSPSIMRLSSKDHHCLSFTIVIQILLTYPVNFLLSSGNEDTIFNPGIFTFHFSSLEPVAFESQMEVCFSTCFIPKDK